MTDLLKYSTANVKQKLYDGEIVTIFYGMAESTVHSELEIVKNELPTRKSGLYSLKGGNIINFYS